MKELTKKIYYCEHCKKHGLSKGHMAFHEKWCDNNPENKKACIGCANLESVEIDGVYFDHEGNDYSRKFNGFRCKALDKKLYPLKAERKDLPNKYPGTFDDQEPMPKECEQYKSEFEF
jgi:hypothetical protein